MPIDLVVNVGGLLLEVNIIWGAVNKVDMVELVELIVGPVTVPVYVAPESNAYEVKADVRA